MADPTSVEEWLALAAQHEEIARFACESRTAAQQGYFHVLMAVECTLKAYIWHRERFDHPPSQQDRPDLYSHNLRVLKDLSGITISRHDPTAPAWFVILQADRAQYYNPKPMPRRVSRAMLEAAFGLDGVVTWLASRITRR